MRGAAAASARRHLAILAGSVHRRLVSSASSSLGRLRSITSNEMANGGPGIDERMPQAEAALRLVIGVVAVIALLVALVFGLGLCIPDDRPAGVRVAGGVLVLGAVAGTVALLRWARGSSWAYDRPTEGVSASGGFLLGVGSIVLFAILVEPLGPWALIAFLLPVALVARFRYDVSTVDVLVLCLGLVGAILATLNLIFALAPGLAGTAAIVAGVGVAYAAGARWFVGRDQPPSGRARATE
jgi:hypothetical protein